MRLRSLFVLAVVASFALMTCPSWAQSCYAVPGNLVANCGFETGNFANWTQTGDTSFTGVDGNPHTGNYAAYLGSTSGDDYLTQWVGDYSRIYYVSFWLYSDGGTPNNFTVLWNGVDVGPDLVNSGYFPYTEYAGYLYGNWGPGSNELTFVSFQLPAYWWLDDVVVTNVPEPGSLILFGSGILCLAGLVRRKLSI